MKNIEFYKKDLLKYNNFLEAVSFAREQGMPVKERNDGTLCLYKDFIKWLNEEYSILDNTERRYLSNIIKPLKTEHTYVKKMGLEDAEYIRIGGLYGYIEEDTDLIEMPFFEKGTMYKGMELDRVYTLEELGL